MNSPEKKECMLENAAGNVRIKLSALWVAVMHCYTEGDFISLSLQKEKIENLFK